MFDWIRRNLRLREQNATGDDAVADAVAASSYAKPAALGHVTEPTVAPREPTMSPRSLTAHDQAYRLFNTAVPVILIYEVGGRRWKRNVEKGARVGPVAARQL